VKRTRVGLETGMAELISKEKVVVKFIFPCGGISFLKVSEEEKRRFDAGNSSRLNLKNKKYILVCNWFTDPDFKKKIMDAVYNQFLKQKEQTDIQEQLRVEEENRILAGHVGTLFIIFK
jgi:hypothetical protein